MPLDGTRLNLSFEALEKMDKVQDLLAREDHWGTQLLPCHGGRYCILGAMLEVNAFALLRDPILLAIKQVAGRSLRIEAFTTIHRPRMSWC
jgi:hypothetical protein